MKPLAQNTLIQNRYLIVQLIGKGGMGEVYLAVDQRLGSAIALKRTYFAGDDTLGSAFEREARVLARLRHPVLPKVSDHFGEGDEQFLVMEHISGDDLSIRIEAQQKPFPLSWVMFWADQLLDALSYLHSHEPPIIHRDIKPQNLKLTDENHIILLDFGLSKTSTGMTNISGGSTGSTGSVVGYTPHYAPMEQIRGIGTSARSDLYSLSATLYQLMTNIVPVDALSRADTMLNGLPDPIVPPSDINPEVPPTISDVVLKGMEVSQEKRYENAREMQKALRRAFSDMQQAMSAKTMVISADELAGNGAEQTPNFDATEVMNPGDLASASSPIQNPSTPGRLSSLPTPDVPIEKVDQVDLNATIAYDSSSTSQPEPMKQADVKTEVFIGGMIGGPSEAPPLTEQYGGFTGGTKGGNSDPGGKYDPSPAAEEWGGATAETAEPSGYSPEATVPLIAFESGQGLTGTSSFDGGVSASDAVHEDPVYKPSEEIRPVAKPKAKKSSTKKIVAILGGLFLFFVVVLGAAGGGYYYYTNYYLPGLEPTPTPSPEPTLEPSPTPEVTPSLAIDDSNTISNSNSNSNSLVEPTPTATPVEEPTREPDIRPDKPDRRATPRPRNSRTPKPRPTKKPAGPDIIP